MPTRKKKNVFGWLRRKEVTYHRDVAAERKKLKAEAMADRRERLAVQKLRAQELAAEAKIKTAERKIAATEERIAKAEKKADKGGMAEAQFEAMKTRIEREIQAQEAHKRAALAKLSNPKRCGRNPADSAAQYRLAQAILSGTARDTRMSKKAAREIVDRTPARLRSEYSKNPGAESSTEYRLGYNLGQMDRQNAAMRKTLGELRATFGANFGPGNVLVSPSWEAFECGYSAGYSGAMGAAAPNPLHETPFRYKGVTITPVPPTFVRYDVALRTGTIRVSSIQDAKDWVTRSLDPRFTHGRNPEPADHPEEYQQAKRIAELFHGRVVKEEIEIHDAVHTHDWYAELGPMIELRVKGLRGYPYRTAKFKFSLKGDALIHMLTSPDGRQFYLRGGDQELDLKPLGMEKGTEWFRHLMSIGEVTYFVYRDGKKFHGFKITDYSHKVGSGLDSSGTRHVQNTNVRPVMIYDTLSKKISFAGGLGKVETENLVDGMSPGIVN